MSLGGLYMEGLIFGVLWYVEVGRVVDKACHRLQTKKKHYNMILSSVIYIMALSALFQNKEGFLCLARQKKKRVLNKDKRIDDLDIKSMHQEKKYSKDFLRLNDSKLDQFNRVG